MKPRTLTSFPGSGHFPKRVCHQFCDHIVLASHKETPILSVFSRRQLVLIQETTSLKQVLKCNLAVSESPLTFKII